MTPSETIIINMADGSVSVMGFVTIGSSPTLPFGAVWTGIGTWFREATDENIQAEINKAFAPEFTAVLPVSWERANGVATPQDRTFREAWTYDKGFGHDMVKARAIHLDRLRIERDKTLKNLDKDWMRATGQKDPAVADAVEAKRQELRDAPATLAPDLEAALTIEELKAIKLPE